MILEPFVERFEGMVEMKAGAKAIGEAEKAKNGPINACFLHSWIFTKIYCYIWVVNEVTHLKVAHSGAFIVGLALLI